MRINIKETIVGFGIGLLFSYKFIGVGTFLIFLGVIGILLESNSK